jgi:hypothetical protein
MAGGQFVACHFPVEHVSSNGSPTQATAATVGGS